MLAHVLSRVRFVICLSSKKVFLLILCSSSNRNYRKYRLYRTLFIVSKDLKEIETELEGLERIRPFI